MKGLQKHFPLVIICFSVTLTNENFTNLTIDSLPRSRFLDVTQGGALCDIQKRAAWETTQ